MHAFFHFVWNGIGTVRILVSSHQLQKIVQTFFHVLDRGTEQICHDLNKQSHPNLVIGNSVHQAQLSVSFEKRCFQLSSRSSVLCIV